MANPDDLTAGQLEAVRQIVTRHLEFAMKSATLIWSNAEAINLLQQHLARMTVLTDEEQGVVVIYSGEAVL